MDLTGKEDLGNGVVKDLKYNTFYAKVGDQLHGYFTTEIGALEFYKREMEEINRIRLEENHVDGD